MDDAVLCSKNKTYALRSVTLSNSILVATPPLSDEAFDITNQNVLVIRSSVSQILEVSPSLPKLQRLEALLRGATYNEADDEDRAGGDDTGLVSQATLKFVHHNIDMNLGG